MQWLPFWYKQDQKFAYGITDSKSFYPKCESNKYTMVNDSK